MKALGYDDHPDVAGSIGFAYAKLGNPDEARAWYNKALAADPNHVAPWATPARFTSRRAISPRHAAISTQAICGGAACPEYQELEGLIAAKSR